MDNRKINKKEFINLINKNRGIIHKITLMYTSTTADKEDLYPLHNSSTRKYACNCGDLLVITGESRKSAPGFTGLP